MKLKHLLLIVLLFVMSACTPIGGGRRAPLDLPPVEPLHMRDVKWSVLPRDDRGTSPDVIKHSILFGLSEAGYKSLAQNIQEIISFIGLQQKVLDSYQKYYEQDQVRTR